MIKNIPIPNIFAKNVSGTLSFILVLCLSMILYIVISPNNLGVTPDSVKYIEAAENISLGKGYVVNNQVLTHWPPVYSILLSCTSKITNSSVLNSGIYLNVTLFLALGITLIFIFKEIGFNENINYFLIATILTIKPLTIAIYFWSELPFILFIAIAFYVYLRWKKNQNRFILLPVGTLCMLAFLTRYAAIGILVGFCINIMLWGKRTLKNKLLDLLYFSFPVFMGAGAWFYITNTNIGNIGNRNFVVHIISPHKILDPQLEIVSWFGRETISQSVLALLIIIFIFYSLKFKNNLKLYFKNTKFNFSDPIIIILSYLIFLYISISLFDTHTPLDFRILSPLAIFIFILIGYFLMFFASNIPKLSLNVVMLLIFLCGINSSRQVWLGHFENGNGFTSVKYHPYMEVMRRYILKYEGKIYSNGDDFIQFFNEKHDNISSLPHKVNPVTNEIDPNYTAKSHEMYNDVLLNKAQVVYFDKISWRSYLMPKEDLMKLMQDFKLIEFERGMIIKSCSE